MGIGKLCLLNKRSKLGNTYLKPHQPPKNATGGQATDAKMQNLSIEGA
jgi:hypothetical protein